jgi:hypothetical protein
VWASCRSPPAEAIEGDLIERRCLDASLLAFVVPTAVLLQALECLALTCSVGQLGTALGHRLILAAEILGVCTDGVLGPLEVGLSRHQINRACSRGGQVQLSVTRAGNSIGRLLQLAFRTLTLDHRAGECLLCGILAALSQSTHALESKSVRGTGHVLFIGVLAPVLEANGHVYEKLMVAVDIGYRASDRAGMAAAAPPGVPIAIWGE